MVDVVIVVEHAGVCVPEELVDRGFAGGGAAGPFGGFVGALEQRRRSVPCLARICRAGC